MTIYFFIFLFYNAHSSETPTRYPEEWASYCRNYKNLSTNEKIECKRLFNPLTIQKLPINQIILILELIPNISQDDLPLKKSFKFVHEVFQIIKGKLYQDQGNKFKEDYLKLFRVMYFYSIDYELSEMFYHTALNVKKLRELSYKEEKELTSSLYFSKNWKTLARFLKENKLFKTSSLFMTFVKKMSTLKNKNHSNLIFMNHNLQPSYVNFNLKKKKIVLVTSLTCGFSLKLLEEIEKNDLIRKLLKTNGIFVFSHYEFDNIPLLEDWMKKMPEQSFAYINSYKKWPNEIDWFATPNTLIIENNRLVDQQITNSINQILNLFKPTSKESIRP